jgi:predicted lipoprotein
MELTVHVHLHSHSDPAVLRLLADIANKQEQHMAVSNEMRGVIDRINTATNTIAAKLRDVQTKLEAALADAGMPAGDEASAVSELGTIATQLEGIGADPADPVPTDTP